MSFTNFEQNQQIQKYINVLNYKLNSLNSENGNEKKILLDYRKNLINIPIEKYQATKTDDLILAYYNRFTLLAYIHISLHEESIGIEYIRTMNIYQNKGNCKLLLSVLIILSRSINPKLNMIHLDSISNNLTYLCIFTFDAIPQVLYYKNNSFSTDIKDDDKSFEFKAEIAEIKDKTKEEQYNYIESLDSRFGNDLFLIIDINDSIVSMIEL
jgi:hypothetical protein